MKKCLIATALAVASIAPAQAQTQPCDYHETFLNTVDQGAHEAFRQAEVYLLQNQRMPAIYRLALAQDALAGFEKTLAEYQHCKDQIPKTDYQKQMNFLAHEVDAKDLRRRLDHAAKALGQHSAPPPSVMVPYPDGPCIDLDEALRIKPNSRGSFRLGMPDLFDGQSRFPCGYKRGYYIDSLF